MSTKITLKMGCKNCGDLLAPECIAGVYKHFNGSYYCSANRTHAEPEELPTDHRGNPLCVIIEDPSKKTVGTSTEQPMPIPNESVPIWELVIEDMKERDKVGRQRYGTPLQTNNGRDALLDAYQEALDLVVYLRQEIEERKQRCNSISNS